MTHKECVETLWKAFDEQRWDDAGLVLDDGFIADWVVTNERLDKTNFLNVNRNYPGKWHTELQHFEQTETGGVSVVHVYALDNQARFYAVTFYKFKGNKISHIQEYWSTVEHAPEWRKEYGQL